MTPNRCWPPDRPRDLLVLRDRVLLGRLPAARGVRLRRRHAAPVPSRRGGALGDVREHRPRLGRERGVAGGRRRRHLRGVPGLVRDDVLGVVPAVARDPRLPDRPGRCPSTSGAATARARRRRVASCTASTAGKRGRAVLLGRGARGAAAQACRVDRTARPSPGTSATCPASTPWSPGGAHPCCCSPSTARRYLTLRTGRRARRARGRRLGAAARGARPPSFVRRHAGVDRGWSLFGPQRTRTGSLPVVVPAGDRRGRGRRSPAGARRAARRGGRSRLTAATAGLLCRDAVRRASMPAT